MLDILKLVDNGNLRYRPPSLPHTNTKDDVVGVPFDIREAYLTNIGYPLNEFVQLTSSSVNEFVFVTAANGLFFDRDMDAIATVQQFFPNNDIYFYDLSHGLLVKYREKVSVETK